MKTAIYTRVSTGRQAEDGVSMEAQEQKARQYAGFNDCDIVEVCRDGGISGKTTNRPGFKQVMELVTARKVQAVIVYSLSRFARNTVDTLQAIEKMNQYGVSLVSLAEKLDTGSPTGRFFITTLAGLATLEREQIGQRTSTALQYKKTQHERVGQIPFGFNLCQDGKHLEKNKAEQEAITLVLKLRKQGQSYEKIAKELEARKIKNKVGVIKWYRSSIRNILKNYSINSGNLWTPARSAVNA